MPPPLSWALQALLAITFVWAAGAKVAHWSSWRATLPGYGIPGRLLAPVALLVPVLELTVATLTVAGATRVAMAAALALLSAFSYAVLRARVRQGDRLPCGCFGRTEERDYRVMLLRNSFLAALAALVLLFGERADLRSGSGAPDLDDVVPGLLVAVGALLVVWMAKHATSLLQRRENT